MRQKIAPFIFLANVNSRSYVIIFIHHTLVENKQNKQNNIVSPSVVCRLSVTFVHPTQKIEIFGNISTSFGTLAIC